ncbi:Slo-2 [Aphelenchoides besseyi]|nr:Slo-2 [Aphelenchoides besseyi]
MTVFDEDDQEDAKSEFGRMQRGNDDVKTKIQQYFIENHESSLRIRSFNFFIKLLSCIVYCVQVIWNDGKLPENIENHLILDSKSLSCLIWTNRTYGIWICQVIVAVASIVCTIVIFYITFKGTLLRLFTYSHFLLELLTGMPLILSIFVPILRDVNVPIFFELLDRQ